MRKQKSFTLIELMVVISIIGLISGIVLVAVNSAREKAKRTAGLQFAAQVHHALGSEAVGIWDFDDQTNPTKDVSGYNNHGTLYNFPANPWKCAGTDTPSGQGCSLVYDGTDDNVAVSNAVAGLKINGSNFITESVWVYPTIMDNTKNRLILDSWPGIRFSLTRTYQSVPSVIIRTTDFAERYVDFPALNINTWYHLVWTYNSETQKIQSYINGSLYRTTTGVTGTLIHTNNTLYVGSIVEGSLDDVRIYSQSLTQAQVEALYAEGAKLHGHLAEEK